jgi:hypothetical protein
MFNNQILSDILVFYRTYWKDLCSSWLLSNSWLNVHIAYITTMDNAKADAELGSIMA